MVWPVLRKVGRRVERMQRATINPWRNRPEQLVHALSIAEQPGLNVFSCQGQQASAPLAALMLIHHPLGLQTLHKKVLHR